MPLDSVEENGNNVVGQAGATQPETQPEVESVEEVTTE